MIQVSGCAAQQAEAPLKPAEFSFVESLSQNPEYIPRHHYYCVEVQII
jgi:hypothetical protein